MTRSNEPRMVPVWPAGGFSRLAAGHSAGCAVPRAPKAVCALHFCPRTGAVEWLCHTRPGAEHPTGRSWPGVPWHGHSVSPAGDSPGLLRSRLWLPPRSALVGAGSSTEPGLSFLFSYSRIALCVSPPRLRHTTHLSPHRSPHSVLYHLACQPPVCIIELC